MRLITLALLLSLSSSALANGYTNSIQGVINPPETVCESERFSVNVINYMMKKGSLYGFRGTYWTSIHSNWFSDLPDSKRPQAMERVMKHVESLQSSERTFNEYQMSVRNLFCK